ncbi:cupin domain-containing protein [Fusobacterium perfoetens]|uniref:cupin domain-containing protein n=1 Tax=Fusobacterium perfoetens TaxID=852 RepID=UPI00055D79C4|nr:cupin domain-containing protein [Fusobacterium perfoetens]MCI6151760.1 cupin domain-containing protein [Fusobacterium perfoetens]MDY3236879.1 cupin domain-containing protein [Fusobacterium perfoetens]
MIQNFFINDEIKFEDLGDGVKRKILAHNNPLMIVEVHFNKGAKGYQHKHKHSQVTYILEGKFQFIVNGKERIVQKGDSIYIESETLHGTTCLEQGILLDIFTPEREDFLKI